MRIGGLQMVGFSGEDYYEMNQYLLESISFYGEKSNLLSFHRVPQHDRETTLSLTTSPMRASRAHSVVIMFAICPDFSLRQMDLDSFNSCIPISHE